MPVIKRILCPVDFSDTAALGAREAAALARAAGAELLLIHTLQEPWFSGRGQRGYLSPVAQQYEFVVQRKLEEAASPLRAMTTVRTLLTYGAVDEAIAQAAVKHAADLIVMGTRPRGGIARMLTDSMTEKVMRRARVPVVRVCPSVRRNRQLNQSAHGTA